MYRALFLLLVFTAIACTDSLASGSKAFWERQYQWEREYSAGKIQKKLFPKKDPHKQEFLKVQELARQGDTEAQFKLAQMYYEGRGVKRSGWQATDPMRDLAKRGILKAQFALAEMLRGGDHKVGSKAGYWYQKAAKRGHPIAQFYLGEAYRTGSTGIPMNYLAAANWYKRSAEQGYARAMYEIALMHQKGHGVNKDLKKAHMWLNLAIVNRCSHCGNASKILKGLEETMSTKDINLAQNQALGWWEQHSDVMWLNRRKKK